MHKKIMSTGLSWFWLALVIMLFDIGSKQFVMRHCWLSESVPVMPFINFTYAHNPCAAFSCLAEKGELQRWILSFISVIIIVFHLVIMYRLDKQAILTNIVYSIIVGGALGNLFDRMVHSFVIDFIIFYVGDWYWPTFNVADIGICMGAILGLVFLPVGHTTR
ncbi:Lipoprotein signal peptidase [Candidatus Moranella endobia PCVAL]|uniref:signal peptidase II n=1 Tax=Candidatus Moranella endobia TaxID=1048758 RepID=UPI0002C6ACC7|nr:signal peptidase II [Candidatus Moranella endobia]AGJ61398.1 Lipoprotein signal peptidase [Candidatus Moranella endobia PCVAL]